MESIEILRAIRGHFPSWGQNRAISDNSIPALAEAINCTVSQINDALLWGVKQRLVKVVVSLETETANWTLAKKAEKQI